MAYYRVYPLPHPALHLAPFLLVIFIPKEGIMNTKVLVAIAVSAVLLSCSAIIGGVYVGICHGNYPVTACEVDKD